MRLQRKAVGGLVAAGAVVVVLAVSAWRSPHIIRQRVVEWARARGLQAHVGDVSIGLSSVELQDVVLKTSKALRVAVGSMRIEPGPIALAWGGTAAITGGTVRKVDLKLHVDESSSTELKPLFGAATRSAEKGSQHKVGRRLGVEGLAVRVEDEHGALLEATGRAQLANGALTLSLKQARLGAAPQTELVAKGIELTVEREGPRLRGGRVQRADLRLPAQAGAATLGRLLDLRDRLRGVRGSAPATPAAKGNGLGIAGLFAPKAEIALDGGEVVDGRGQPLLDRVKASVGLAGEDALHLVASGHAASGGSLSCDLALWPHALRADGEVEIRALPLALAAPLLPALPWHEPEAARLDARLQIEGKGLEQIGLEGNAVLRDAALSSPRIAPEPVQLGQLEVSGRGRWFPLRRRLEIEEGNLSLGEVAVGIDGALELSDAHYLIDVDAKLPATKCTTAVQAIPEALLGDMRHARWAGKIGGGIELTLDSRDLAATVLEFDVNDGCAFVEVPIMADLQRFHGPFVHSVVEPGGEVFEMRTGPGTPAWTDFSDISPFLVHAVLAHEDVQFFSHRGFSPLHIRNALVRNLEAGRYVIGASTITMQLVKNVFLHREKTLARKVQEVLLTWWTERVMNKRSILELYLNVIEYGPGVYGIRNGARHYFNRLPSDLSPAEAVYLSTILPNPKGYHSHFERGAPPPQWFDRMRKIFARMRSRGWYSPEAVEYGLAELQRFRFVPEGTPTEAREIPGHAAPLPDAPEVFDVDDIFGDVDTPSTFDDLSP
jgi:hypothetical protein